jgi:hypothetical protein
MLYAIPGCPVDNYDKDWLEKALLWFEHKLGCDYIMNKKYLVPAYCKFQYPDFNTHEAIQYFIEYICDFISLDAGLISFELIWDNDKELDDFAENVLSNIANSSQTGVANTQRYGIYIFTKDINDFDITFNSIAYQLTYIKLEYQSVFNFPNKYMIDFAMLIEGFGILNTNNFVTSRQWHDYRYSAWHVKAYGSFNHRMYGYLLALLNEYRNGIDDKTLETFLCSDAKAFYLQSKNFLAKEKELGHLTSLKGRIIKDEEVFIQKQFYGNGGIRIISHVVDGKFEGRMIFFHQNGQLWSERLYKNNNSYTVFSNFNKYGDAVEKGTLSQGNGTLYIYNPDGSLDKIEEYFNGNKIN